MLHAEVDNEHPSEFVCVCFLVSMDGLVILSRICNVTTYMNGVTSRILFQLQVERIETEMEDSIEVILLVNNFDIDETNYPQRIAEQKGKTKSKKRLGGKL